MTWSFTQCFKRVASFFAPQRNRGRNGYSLSFLFSKGGLFELEGLVPLRFSRITLTDFFLLVISTIGVWLGLTIELDQEVLHIDSLLRGAASINLENDRKDKSPEIFRIPPSYRGGWHWQALLRLLDRSILGLSCGIFSHIYLGPPLDIIVFYRVQRGRTWLQHRTILCWIVIQGAPNCAPTNPSFNLTY